ncbi:MULTISPECIES: hypothetical protein [unclassified Xanthobacter]|uniref:hypothetical protein n=1 Tax=unclassified Xanthobacter TaxID=2623496 RepID=UPI001F31CAD5|nr:MULTISPECIES: hypothetical protein [unclassified Xanthobacter]
MIRLPKVAKGPTLMLDQRDPVVVADTGPLLRLAAAHLLDAVRLTNRQIVIVDMVEMEACHRHPDKPYAREILDWIERSGEAVRRVETVEGIAYSALLGRERTPETMVKLKRLQRDGGERAVRDFVEELAPTDVRSVLVLHEDLQVPRLLQASKVPLQLVTTKLFLQELARQGMNVDVEAAVRAIREVPFTLAEAQETRLRPYDEPDDDGEFSPPSGPGSTGPGSSM